MQCRSCAADLPGDARFCSQCGAAVQATPAVARDLIREKLEAALPPNLQIVRPLGKGGMGAVYLARDTYLEREVAIKTLPSDAARTEELRERFRREARIAARLTHPNIVPLHMFGEAQDTLYYVMGYVAGETLAVRIAREKKITPAETRRIIAEIADALAYAHQQGIVHRDLKPENILLDDVSGRAVLADFGIARITTATDSLTRTGAIIGTPQYMSPEQASGEPLDARSDIYSLGVVGYRMLTGTSPFSADSLAQLIAQHASRTPPPITDQTVPHDLTVAVMRCLEKDPAQRWASAAELKSILHNESRTEEPEELQQVESVGTYVAALLLIALVLSPLEIFSWASMESAERSILTALQGIPIVGALFLAMRIGECRKAGVSWRAIWIAAFRLPGWYWGWTPHILRRPGDMWDQLPMPVRQARNAIACAVTLGSAGFATLAAAMVMPTLAAAVLSDERFMNVFVTIQMVFVFWMVIAAAWTTVHLRRRHVDSAASRALLQTPTWRLSIAKYPGIAAVLHGSAAGEAADPATVVRSSATTVKT